MPLARRIACLGLASVAMLALAGTAWAQPPITGTDVSTFSESFSDESTLCQDELYTTTVDGHAVPKGARVDDVFICGINRKVGWQRSARDLLQRRPGVAAIVASRHR
jgi:hypothetical protein